MNNMQARRNLCNQSPVLQNSIHVNQICIITIKYNFCNLFKQCQNSKGEQMPHVEQSDLSLG